MTNSQPPNLYSLLFTNSIKENKINELINRNSKDIDDEDYLDSLKGDTEDNMFILDAKLKQERDKRLNEKDKIYKFKKHYFLKDTYKKIVEEEHVQQEYEKLKEDDYIHKCEKADLKLLQDANLNANDVYYILKRNFQMFSTYDKEDLKKLQRLYKIYNLSCIGSSIFLVTYVRAIMLFFKFEIKSKFTSYIFLTIYGVGIYFSLKHFVDLSYVKNLKGYCYKNKDLIFDYENIYLKTPYDQNEKTYKPEEKNLADLFKF